ncbi:MAG: hypothetical protein KDK23_15555 [Leptospiraceae bacterium]|nr:hypothetical protein [Leptospiraceae bacterium]
MAVATVLKEKKSEQNLRKVLLRNRRDARPVDEKTGIRFNCNCKNGNCGDPRCIRGLV